MAPLDTGEIMNLRLVDPLLERAGPSPTDYDAIGAYLRAVREFRGLSLATLGDATRVSRVHLQAIEEGDLSALPSRPFAIGYVRAYALALGVDGDAAAARYKKETPDFSEPLRNPIGVGHEGKRSNPLIIALVALAVIGVVAWNVTQHSMVKSGRASKTASLSAAPTATPVQTGPIALGAATPPPPDQTMPAPYVTPGMDLAGAPAGETSKVMPLAAQVAAKPPATAYVPSPTFTPKGAVYGPAGPRSAMIMQANKAAALIVRGTGGAVYFARQLAPGEAYRAILGAGLIADVADPSAFDLYFDNRLQPALPPGLTPIDKIVIRPATPPPGLGSGPDQGATPPTAAAPAAKASPGAPAGAPGGVHPGAYPGAYPGAAVSRAAGSGSKSVSNSVSNSVSGSAMGGPSGDDRGASTKSSASGADATAQH